MTIVEGIKKYDLQNPCSREALDLEFNHVLRFNDNILVAGYFFSGHKKPCYYGIVYEFLTDDKSCEGALGIKAVSELMFEDEGHAIAWGMEQ